MRRRPCVRCGSRDRIEGLFICDLCTADSTKEDELRQAREFAAGIGDPRDEMRASRQFLVEVMRWAGRW